jgi:hypothetical protein
MKKNKIVFANFRRPITGCDGFISLPFYYAFPPYYLLLSDCPFNRMYALKPKNPE